MIEHISKHTIYYYHLVLLHLAIYSTIIDSHLLLSELHLEDAALALDILDELDIELTAVGMANLGSEGLGGLPAGRSARSSLLHHAVDLLQRQTLGLGDQEVSVDKSASTL